MAFGLKYFFEFDDIETRSYRVEISLEGYVGGTTELKTGGVPITLNYEAEDPYKSVFISSNVNVELQAETDFQFKEFFSSAFGNYELRLIEDPGVTDKLLWLGYNVADAYNEPYADTPYPINLKFSDGLSEFDETRFEDTGEVLFEGQKHLLEMLRLCLNTLPTPLGIQEVINVYEDSQNSGLGDSMMTQTFVWSKIYRETDKNGDSSTERGMFINEVLQELLEPQGVRIHQQFGEWRIVRIEELQGADLKFRKFDAKVGDESNTTVESFGTDTHNVKLKFDTDNPNRLRWSGPGDLNMLPRVRRIKYRYNSDTDIMPDSDLIRNGRFMEWETGEPPYLWTVGSGIDLSSYEARNSHGAFKSFKFQAVEVQETTVNTDNFISYVNTGVPTSILDKLFIRFTAQLSVSLTGQGGVASAARIVFLQRDAFINVFLEIKMGDFFLTGDLFTGLQWELSPSDPFLKLQYTGDHMEIRQNISAGFSFLSKNILTPTLPEDGFKDFSIKMFSPFDGNIGLFNASNPTSTIDIQDAYVSNFSAIYRPGGESAINAVNIEAQTDPNAEVFEIEVMNGDGPGFNSAGAYRLSDGLLTSIWDRRGFTDNSGIGNILVNSVFDLRSVYRRMISGVITDTGDLYPQNSVETRVATQAGTDTIISLINRISWDVKGTERSVELLEVSSDLTPLTGSFETVDEGSLLNNPNVTTENDLILPLILNEISSTPKINISESATITTVKNSSFINFPT